MYRALGLGFRALRVHVPHSLVRGAVVIVLVVQAFGEVCGY